MFAGCLNDDVVVALLDGRLLDDELADAQRHLASCSQCLATLADAARGARASGVVVAESDHAVELACMLSAGALIDGKYRVERLLGHGGMGSVVAARHVELGHSVAIKILRREGADAAARLLREAQICACISNEHIVRVFDMGRLASGTPYLVMEHLQGHDLARELVHGPLPLVDALRFMLEACAALQAAHEAGIVHRDLKPANLFLVKSPGHPTVIKVLDFGISKHLNPEHALDLTSTGVVLGSPLYMSPEQLRGAPDIDARTDVWSLGVVLYELLTGRLPFRAPTLSALAVSIATARHPPMSAICPDLPSVLDEIVQRCLQKDPLERFASVAALRSELAKVPLVPRGNASRKRTSRALAAIWVAALTLLSGHASGHRAQVPVEPAVGAQHTVAGALHTSSAPLIAPSTLELESPSSVTVRPRRIKARRTATNAVAIPHAAARTGPFDTPD